MTRGDLAAAVSVAGTLTFAARSDGSPYTAINQASGVYTDLPSAGQEIAQGQVLYRVNDSPVVLLHGSTPAYRTLSAGATGADVSELNADLVALGDATTAQLSPAPESFGSATTAAVEKLQAAVGETPTGTLALGQVVFEPATLRVTSLSAQLGGSAQPGQVVMQATSTNRQVQVDLNASQQTDVAVGDKVTITLPDNRTTPGVISSVGTVATCPPSSGSGPTTSPTPLGADNCSSTGPGSNSTPTVAVAVTPSDPAATGTWDQAPVEVGITTARVPDALAVPVTALLAQTGGGYSVEVVGPGGISHLVAVSLGLFDDSAGLVQVNGPGLAAGQKVVVPAP
ncbi:MAG: HlyD family efflux transporter periplasmic adaptor subunit [Acidobacteriota bacterium]|nr:HlyD family efflux transporter periplasmic adaptor subunit [Acidobacteriota bacterium]